MDTSRCTQWGCPNPVMEWEVVDQAMNTVMANYCGPHGQDVAKQNITGYVVRKINQEGSTPMPTQPAQAPMAPPDAVYDPEDDVPGPLPEQLQTGVQPPSAEEASTNFFWKLPGQTMTFELQTTVRGAPSAPQIMMHVQSVLAAIRTVVANGGKAKFDHPPAATTAASPTTQPAPPLPLGTPAPLPPGTPAPPPAPPTPQTPQPGPKPVQVLQCIKIKIVPRTDGKSEIHFFGQGAQYPNLKLIREIPELVEFMSPMGQGAWLDQHMRAPGEYQYPCKVQWCESDKLNSKGNPYKNVVGIAP